MYSNTDFFWGGPVAVLPLSKANALGTTAAEPFKGSTAASATVTPPLRDRKYGVNAAQMHSKAFGQQRSITQGSVAVWGVCVAVYRPGPRVATGPGMRLGELHSLLPLLVNIFGFLQSSASCLHGISWENLSSCPLTAKSHIPQSNSKSAKHVCPL